MTRSVLLLPLTPDEQRQVEDNMKLVWWEARRARPLDEAEADDLVQEGVFGLIEAIRTYNAARGSWSGWAYWCIRRRLYRYRACEGVIRLPVPKSSALEVDKWKREQARKLIALEEVEEAGLWESGADHALADDALVLALERIHTAERELLHRRFVMGDSVRTIGMCLGISHQRVSQKIAVAISNLRLAYERLGAVS